MYQGFINPNASDKVIYDHYRAVLRKLPRSVAKKPMDRHLKSVQMVADRRSLLIEQVEQIISEGRQGNL